MNGGCPSTMPASQREKEEAGWKGDEFNSGHGGFQFGLGQWIS